MATPGRINLSGNVSIQTLFNFGQGNSRWYRINNSGKVRMTVLQDDQTIMDDHSFLIEPGLSADFFAWRLVVVREGQGNIEGNFETL